mgnify:CR=1 FL=1
MAFSERIVEAIESSDFNSLPSVMERLLKGRGELLKTFLSLFSKYKNLAVFDCTREFRILVKYFDNKAISILQKILEKGQKEFGKCRIFLVNLEAVPYSWKVKAPEGLESLKKLIEMHGTPTRFLHVIIARASFLDNLIALRKIFNEIFETDSAWIISILAADIIGDSWVKYETLFIRESELRPALKEFLPIFHAATHSKNKVDAIMFMEDMIRKLGLGIRKWNRSISLTKRISDFIDAMIKIQMPQLDIILKGFYMLNKKLIQLKDFCFLLLGSLPISREAKMSWILTNGCVPRQDLLENLVKINVEPRRIAEILAKKLMDAERKWAPEVSIAELLGISWLTYVSSTMFITWLEDKIRVLTQKFAVSEYGLPEELLDILKLALIFVVSEIKCKYDDCSIVVRVLYAVRKRFVEYPIVLLSNIAELLRTFDAVKFSTALYIQRILEIHGYRHYLYLIDKIYTKEEMIYVVSLQNMFASRFGIVSRKAIALSMKNPDALRLVNTILVNSALKPNGVTAPLYWELTQRITQKLGDIVRLALDYFIDNGVEPNSLLEQLFDLLKLYPKVEQIKENIKSNEINDLKESYINLAFFSSVLEIIRRSLRSLYGKEENPLVNKAKMLISNFTGMLNDAWERLLVSRYWEIISGNQYEIVYKVPEYIKDVFKQEKPIILLVIDGLRVDDYLVKLKQMLINRGFKVIEEKSILSLLPSITTISRRAIFGGKQVLELFAPIPYAHKHRMLREDEHLKEQFGPNVLYFHGAVRHVINLLTKLEREKKKIDIIAIVLSELEKAAHGATEGFLARISTEYALEVSRLAEYAAKIFKEKHKKEPILILASDHGLGLFTKVTETKINLILLKLSQRGFLDPAHEPYVSERFALVPLIGSDIIDAVKNFVELEFKGEIYAIPASKLGIKRISLKVRGQDAHDLVLADKILVLFPRGRRKFVTEKRAARRVVLHGGLLPVETIVPFAIMEYQE